MLPEGRAPGIVEQRPGWGRGDSPYPATAAARQPAPLRTLPLAPPAGRRPAAEALRTAPSRCPAPRRRSYRPTARSRSCPPRPSRRTSESRPPAARRRDSPAGLPGPRARPGTGGHPPVRGDRRSASRREPPGRAPACSRAPPRRPRGVRGAAARRQWLGSIACGDSSDGMERAARRTRPSMRVGRRGVSAPAERASGIPPRPPAAVSRHPARRFCAPPVRIRTRSLIFVPDRPDGAPGHRRTRAAAGAAPERARRPRADRSS